MTPEAFGLTWKELIIFVFTVGGFYAEIRSMHKDIIRLEQKQDKYNHLQERVILEEASTKSAHHRCDMLEERLNEHLDQKSI